MFQVLQTANGALRKALEIQFETCSAAQISFELSLQINLPLC